MAWRKRPRLQREVEATGELRDLYSGIKATLGLPRVNSMLQVFAGVPGFLPVFWQAAKPMVQTQEFFAAADRTAAESYTRMHNYFRVPDLRGKVEQLQFSSGAQHELLDVVELYNYNCPLLLIMAAALFQAFEGQPVNTMAGGTPASHPVYSEKPLLVEEEFAPAATRKVYDEIKRTLGAPFLPTSYQAFGRWPDFLCEYWAALKLEMAGLPYEQHRRAIRDSALSLVADLPQQMQLSAEQLSEGGVADSDISTVMQMTDWFLDLSSKQLLNMAFAKIGLEGGVQSKLAA